MNKQLKSTLSELGHKGLEIDKAVYYKTKNKLEVMLHSNDFLHKSQLEHIRQSLLKLLPADIDLDINVKFPDIAMLLETDNKSALNILKACWCELMPALSPVLKESDWELKDSEIIIKAPSGNINTLFPVEILNDIKAYFNKHYGLAYNIIIVASAQKERAADAPDNYAPAQFPQSAIKNVRPNKAQAKPVDTLSVKSHSEKDILLGKAIRKPSVVPMKEVTEESGRITVQGSIVSHDIRITKSGNGIISFYLTDYTNTLSAKMFMDKPQAEKFIQKLENAKNAGFELLVRGDCSYDSYSKELCIRPTDIIRVAANLRKDTADQKRVELHLHTTLSAMDGLTQISDAFSTAARWGHKAIAITDHGVVQAFPKAAKTAKASGIKPIFGVEGYLIPESMPIPIEQNYAVLCIKTINIGTKHTYLAEIAAVCLLGENIIKEYHTAIDHGVVIPMQILQSEGMDYIDFNSAIPIKQALNQVKEFLKGHVIITENRESAERINNFFEQCEIESPVFDFIDALALGKYIVDFSKADDIGSLAIQMGIKQTEANDAKSNAGLTAMLFNQIKSSILKLGVSTIPLFSLKEEPKSRGSGANHIILLAKTQAGMKNLYRLVSYAHICFFHGVPRIPRSLLTLYREGLIVGSACERGELFQAVLNGTDSTTVTDIARQYDFLEIQPIGNNRFMVRNGIVKDDEALRELNRKIVNLGEVLDIPVVATGDVHFLEPKDADYRKIIMHAQGFEDAEEQAPLYFKTTDEMLDEFEYLGAEKALEVVVTNPNMIAESCGTLKPFLEGGPYVPVIENAEAELQERTMTRAHQIYGEELPEIVRLRLDKELNSIIKNGFSSLYLMAQRLVSKSMSDGYLVGSRGSVGSSLVATMIGITEVNPLSPHYVCPKCRHSEFDVAKTKSVCGIDLPDKSCPVCGTSYTKDGYEIPFEVFLGFKGEKIPDIDLNFSGEYQSKAHKYTETMFGEGHAFKAGTVSEIKDKTVYGYVKAYLESQNRTVSRAEVERLITGCTGVKRTTGQHPGGMVVLPADRDILEFTPIQYPADQKEKDTITTHFDYHAIDEQLVKLDILGHDDPTALKMMEDLTGFDPRSLPLDDTETMKLFSSAEPLNVSLDALKCDVGSLGIPEFGTAFVRQILMDTRPNTMEELVRIAGLSHGTDVWLNNAQTLVQNGTATLSEVICTRDDIMNYLIAHGCEPSISFKIMENVRKGRGLIPEMEAAMAEKHIPDWFVDSCKKIQYMFPRAHAAAYVMMSFRIAYYKVHHPLAFYAVYFTVRADAFDVTKALGGAEQVLKNIRLIEKKGKDASDKEAGLLTILEIVYEMNLRGIELLPVDLEKSDAVSFLIENGAIRPPFSSIPGTGQTAAMSIAQARIQSAFSSVEDLKDRGKANSAVITALEQLGCLNDLPQSNQISLF